MVRETREEIGLSIESRHLKLVYLMHRRGTDGGKDKDRVDFFFDLPQWSGESLNCEHDHCNTSV